MNNINNQLSNPIDRFGDLIMMMFAFAAVLFALYCAVRIWGEIRNTPYMDDNGHITDKNGKIL